MSSLHQDDAATLGEELKEHLSSNGSYTVEGLLGEGTFGAVFAVNRTLPDNTIQQLAVKCSSNATTRSEESSILKRLQGAEHIVQTITLNPDPFEGFKREYVVMEAIRGERLYGLINRLGSTGSPTPNRVLWHFFLCLLRGCVGMQWPPERPDSSSTAPEVIRPGLSRGIAHNDLQASNIMISGPEPSHPEHSLVPGLKIMDFGLAKRGNFANTTSNLTDSARIMTLLILQDPKPRPSGRSMFNVTIGGESSEIESRASPRLNDRASLPNLDEELRSLVIRCLAAETEDRPYLQELLPAVEEALGRDETYYKSQGRSHYWNESTAMVAQWVQTVIFQP
ncbi:kinase-like domain-containing protein [Xylariomycetidae sp. FL2044]|nr:kinase-like domain-containing protein [Xylariomycetidae sp. FL2044]